MNLNEILDMLESETTSGMEKKASDVQDEKPNVAEEFTKTASARQEAEDLGAKVAQTLLKQAEDEKAECKEKKEEEKKKDEDDEENGTSKSVEKKDDEKSESDKKFNFEKKEDENMDKKASLVDIITGMLEKSALDDTDSNQADGIKDGATPNNIQQGTAKMIADFDGIQAPTPGTDGVAGGGTVNQILDAIVAKAQGEGADPYDLNTVDKGPVTAVGAERQDDDVEKTAAVVALVEAGVDFDQAVDLVKQAEIEIKADEFEVEKQAAFSTLIEAGIDFDSAIEMVKQACEDLEKQASMGSAVDSGLATAKRVMSSGAAKAKFGARYAAGAAQQAAGPVIRDAKKVKGQAQYLGAALTSKNKDLSKMEAVKGLAKNRAVQVAAGTTAVAGAAGAAYGHKKKAAFDALIEEGFDFETASDLVKQACDELGM